MTGVPGLEHLQKANTLGLPRALRRDADDLEAKLSYAAEKGAKKKAFRDELRNFKNEINDVAVLRSGDCAPNRYSSSAEYDYKLSMTDQTGMTLLLKLSFSSFVIVMPGTTDSQSLSKSLNLEATIDLEDLRRYPPITHSKNECIRDGQMSTQYNVTLTTPAPKHSMKRDSSMI